MDTGSSDGVKLNFIEIAQGMETFITNKQKFEREYIGEMQSILSEIQGNWQNESGNDLSSIENCFNACINSMQKNIIDFSNIMIKSMNELGLGATKISYTTPENMGNNYNIDLDNLY